MFRADLINNIITSNSPEAFNLYNKSFFGEKLDSKIQYSISEAVYLVEEGKISLYSKNKKIPKKEVLKKLQKIDKKISIKYPVYKDLRKKGYIVKAALKFGADFRVYPKGSKPGKKHSKWIVFAEHELNKLNWQDFSAKNRIAHSTKKNLLLAVVDEESDVTYYEVSWIKP